MDDPVRHERFCCCREKWGKQKKATIKNIKDVFFFYTNFFFSMNGTKKIPYSLSIRLYFDQLINLKSIRKADKSKLSCAILIKNIQRGLVEIKIKEFSNISKKWCC